LSLELPDTPAWSKQRQKTISRTHLFGAGMVILGAVSAYMKADIAAVNNLINSGVLLIVSASGLHIGGATIERAVGWLTQPPQPPATQGAQSNGA